MINSDNKEKVPICELGTEILICPRCERRGAVIFLARGDVEVYVAHKGERDGTMVRITEKCEWRSHADFVRDRMGLGQRIEAARRQQRKEEL
jgi:hypothetical protein